MIDMDYEKKYNEALERARKLKEMYPQDAPGYEEVFPELRESEDERIRKAIIELLKEVGRDDTGISENAKCMIAWLEKQKEQPTDAKSHRVINAARRVLENWLYGDVNADVSGDLTELEYAFKDYDGEEKQKENAKSAISIPSDCASDAKCEDRWHKVADFLPDNPREVLCKDEAGNYFIGRYYTSEGWEISNYDDEDKPHDLNPPVSKWIDFPSEKQKEQKPVDYEAEFKKCKDNPLYFYDKYVSIKQKPAEWSPEDEKIIQSLILEVNKYVFFAGIKANKIVNFLKSLRPQPKVELSEDVKKTLDEVSHVLISLNYKQIAKDYKQAVEKLLHSRPSWKPSEEQMEALLWCTAHLGGADRRVLAELYEHLKKLI